MINYEDGRYALDCWLDPGSEAEADQSEYSDEIEELRQRVGTLLRGGRYRYFVLYKRVRGQWEELEHFTEEDLET